MFLCAAVDCVRQVVVADGTIQRDAFALASFQGDSTRSVVYLACCVFLAHHIIFLQSCAFADVGL